MDTPEKSVPKDKSPEKIDPSTWITVAIAEGIAEAMRSMRDIAARWKCNADEQSS